ncbi:hypothetical protein [Flavobacterium pectinovorum]|uniref:YD repeat-containing protein n=1 Tax=Flavobacterium pectinovorum TaxID=29533 RepID=A0A502EKD1_9FLAO|nr:hypothetical protein [Flavobacterium pectinovorum]TPG38158.1 hypothetical protein EAH81_17145 [Flavobacterium pectinovorum]
MKKILCLFGALSMVLMSSCSSDDSSSDASDSILLKKVVLTGTDGKSTVNYKYNGNKLVSVIDDSGEVNMYYTYTGDLITKIEFKFPTGEIEQTNSFTYSADGKLATFVRVEKENDELRGYKEVYTYNANGTISVKSYGGDDKTQTEEGGTSTITFVSGDVSEITSTNSPNHKYVYDAKNNAAKNVLGLDKISFVDGEGTGVFHNEVSDTSGATVWSTYSYTYNSAGYPEKSVDNVEGLKYTSEYFY